MTAENEIELSFQRNTKKTTLGISGLFAGIGGMEFGLERAGHVTRLLCEIDPAARAVLEARFCKGKGTHPVVEPDVTRLSELPSDTDLLTAGFPCQDLSQAGRTRGIDGAASGLVRHVFRLLDEHRRSSASPIPLVLIENVPFMLSLHRGRAMHKLVAAFTRRGYRWAYRIVDSRAFGVPQRRRRVFFLASLSLDPSSVLFADDTTPPTEPEMVCWQDFACGFYSTEGNTGLGWAFDAIPAIKCGSTINIPSPPAVVLRDGRVVTPALAAAERLQGFPAEWTKPAERVARHRERWRLVGNAVTTGAARWVGNRLSSPGEIIHPAKIVELRMDAPWSSAGFGCGERRFSVKASEWPVRWKRRPLDEFLGDEVRPLSVRATDGFVRRFEASSLRKPPGFLQILKEHSSNLASQESARSTDAA